jgi:hypothetical protein
MNSTYWRRHLAVLKARLPQITDDSDYLYVMSHIVTLMAHIGVAERRAQEDILAFYLTVT